MSHAVVSKPADLIRPTIVDRVDAVAVDVHPRRSIVDNAITAEIDIPDVDVRAIATIARTDIEISPVAKIDDAVVSVSEVQAISNVRPVPDIGPVSNVWSVDIRATVGQPISKITIGA